MLRSLSRAPLRSIAESFCKANFVDKGRDNVLYKMDFSRNFTYSEGSMHLAFGAESVRGSLQNQIVNALYLGERERASDLLSYLSHANHPLRADDFIYILNYCATSPDPLFVMETWRIMEEKEIGMNDRCYMSILQALSRGGYLKEAFNWLTLLGENGQAGPSLPMFNCFLNGCARMRSMDHVDDCLKLMESRFIGKSEVTYFELLKLAVWQKNLSAVHEIWKEFTKYYSHSVLSLRKFIWSFASLRDLESAYKALQQMVALAFQENASVKRSAGGQFRSSRLDIPIPSNSDFSIKGHDMPSDGLTSNRECDLRGHHGDTVSLTGVEEYSNKTFSMTEKGCRGLSLDSLASQGALRAELESGSVKRKELENRGFSILNKDIQSKPVSKVVRWSYNDLIHACAQSRKYELAEKLFLQMCNLGLEPSNHTYHGLIRALVSNKGVTAGLKGLNVMEEMQMKPYYATLTTLSRGCSKKLKLDLAEALLDKVSESPSLQMFNDLLAACDFMDQPERAVRVLAKMKKFSLSPNIRTYELLFSLFANVNAPYERGNMLSQVDVAKRINAIETDMVKNGVRHSQISMVNLLKALGSEGMIREMNQYLRLAEFQFFVKNTNPGTSIYNAVLHSLVEAKESRMAIEIFKDMKLRQLPLDSATYTIIIDCCSELRCYKSACVVLSLMLRDGFSPQTCTYTALIKILLTRGDFDEALHLLDQVDVEGLKPDVLLFNTILRKACNKGRIDIVEFIVGRMLQEKIQPDPTTCRHVFSAYAEGGFHSTAIEALQVLSMCMISVEDTVLQEMRNYYEDFVLAEDLEVESRMMNIFKDYQENVALALLNLRWCALAGFTISWLPNDSQWARRLSSRNAFSCR